MRLPNEFIESGVLPPVRFAVCDIGPDSLRVPRAGSTPSISKHDSSGSESGFLAVVVSPPTAHEKYSLTDSLSSICSEMPAGLFVHRP